MRLFHLIYTMRKPVIAKVSGAAIAGGCGLATVCDLVVASEDSTFGYTEVSIGFIPAIVMTFLVRRIGEGRARELALTGKILAAKEAHALGIVNEIVPLFRPSTRECRKLLNRCASTEAPPRWD